MLNISLAWALWNMKCGEYETYIRPETNPASKFM